MFLSKEAYLESLRARIGEDTSEEAIKFVEDFTDTYNHLETRAADQTDWEAKYKENDESWRKKYRERFFDASGEIQKEEQAALNKDSEKLTFNDLFKEREG